VSAGDEGEGKKSSQKKTWVKERKEKVNLSSPPWLA